MSQFVSIQICIVCIIKKRGDLQKSSCTDARVKIHKIIVQILIIFCNLGLKIFRL